MLLKIVKYGLTYLSIVVLFFLFIKLLTFENPGYLDRNNNTKTSKETRGLRNASEEIPKKHFLYEYKTKTSYYSCKSIYCGFNKSHERMFNSYAFEDLTKRFPKAICIGLPKTGTTAALFFLRRHPNIAAFIGEVNFFSNDNLYQKGLGYYLDRMPMSSPNQITFEKSPLYGVSKYREKVMNRIYRYDADIKLLFIVRNPIHKTMSAFQHFFVRARKDDGRSFEQHCIVDGEINRHFYPLSEANFFKALTPWLEIFKREQIHIVNGDNLQVNPYQELRRIEEFLNIPKYFKEEQFIFDEEKGFYCMKEINASQCLGRQSGHKPPKIDPEVEKRIKTWLRPSNEAFYKLAGQNFNWD